MTVEFESLKLLPQIFEMLNKLNDGMNNSTKRWMSVKELSAYLTFGKDKIYKMIDVQFIESEHYYKRENRLLFDKQKIDEWVVNSASNKTSIQDAKLIVDGIMSSIEKV